MRPSRNLLVAVAISLSVLGATAVSAASAQAAVPGNEIASARSGKCVDLAGGSTADGAAIIQWSCYGGTNQRWHITEVVGSEGVKIRNVTTNRCLDVAGKSLNRGARVHQWDCQDAPQNRDASRGSQLWRMVTTGSARGFDYYTLVNVRSGKCLDLPGGSMADGVQLIQYDCSGAQNQLWRSPA